jgi:hypothetical protein
MAGALSANSYWGIYLGPVKWGRLLEETMRIEDHLGRLKRINKKPFLKQK